MSDRVTVGLVYEVGGAVQRVEEQVRVDVAPTDEVADDCCIKRNIRAFDGLRDRGANAVLSRMAMSMHGCVVHHPATVWPLIDVWCPQCTVRRKDGPAAYAGQGIIILMKVPFQEAGGCGHLDIDPAALRREGVPLFCALFPGEAGVGKVGGDYWTTPI